MFVGEGLSCGNLNSGRSIYGKHLESRPYPGAQPDQRTASAQHQRPVDPGDGVVQPADPPDLGKGIHQRLQEGEPCRRPLAL